MTDILKAKIYLAVQDIRTLAARTRPDCGGKRECATCPARIETSDRRNLECLFSVCDSMGERAPGDERKRRPAGYVLSPQP
jgi:hypothetical protein